MAFFGGFAASRRGTRDFAFFCKTAFSRGLWFLSFSFACKSCQIVYTIYRPHGHLAYIGSYGRNIECHEQKRHGAAYPDDLFLWAYGKGFSHRQTKDSDMSLCLFAVFHSHVSFVLTTKTFAQTTKQR